MAATGTQNKAGTSLRHSVGGSFWATFGVPLILFLLIIVFSVMSEAFLTSANLINILRQAAVVAIAAVGTTIVLIAGGIDISQGAIIALSGVASVVIVQQYNLPDWIGISIALMLSAFVGLSNGILAERLRIPAFIATLGTAFVVRGILFVYTNGRSIGLGRGKNLTGPLIQWLGKGFVGPIPVPVVLMLLLYLIAALVMARTVWGMHCYAVGSSPRAAEIAGIRVRRLRIQVYTVAGLLAGLAGIVLAGRLGSAAPGLGTGAEFDILTAVVLGGTSIYGGRGNVLRTLLGALFLATLTNGLILLNVSTFYQQIAVGLVLLAALALDRLQARDA
jgi:ribose transport system permease protein